MSRLKTTNRTFLLVNKVCGSLLDIKQHLSCSKTEELCILYATFNHNALKIVKTSLWLAMMKY